MSKITTIVHSMLSSFGPYRSIGPVSGLKPSYQADRTLSLPAGRQIKVYHATSFADPKLGDVFQQSEDVQEPQHYNDDDHRIENRLDGARHRNVGVDEPEQNADHNE